MRATDVDFGTEPGPDAGALAGVLRPPRGRRGEVALGALLFGATVAAVVVGLGNAGSGRLDPLYAVAFSLSIAWALAGLVGLRLDAPKRLLSTRVLVSLDALLAAVALASSRVAGSAGRHVGAHDLATLAGPLVTALSLHLLLALPGGALASRPRRLVVAAGYIGALVAGAVLVASHETYSPGGAAAGWCLAAVVAVPAARRRYASSAGHGRERLQWFGIGSALGADVALVASVLHALVGWPGDLGAVATGAAVFVPVGLAAGEGRLGPHGGRAFVQVLSVAGFTVVVSAIYLVIVLGLGRAPTSSADREVLGLSMLATGVAAVAYVPARDRLLGWATRLVYGARQAPDEVLRTFGSRMTRAVPMDELLLQLVESLRKTMALTSAEVYTGSGDILERAASSPDRGAGSVSVTEREKPVVARAGVSGNAWASVWLPQLVDGRAGTELRVAPVSHGGALLGLIVVERPSDGDAFREEDARVLTELARQLGLAFHNSQLDATLQTTLDELRRQAAELRESRARVVASGDAERRRVERNLHDGAQQHLVALAVNLRLAREILTEDASAAGEILEGLVGEVQATIQELRELAHGIYPPLLVDAGVVEALRAAANRSPLSVSLVASGVGRYPSEVEAAVYFCCMEALQNATKHAPGARVELRIWEEAGGLLFSVHDDGPGYDAEVARRGHGFMNMADRLGAIGGTVRWESEPGSGAEVRGSVPLG